MHKLQTKYTIQLSQFVLFLVAAVVRNRPLVSAFSVISSSTVSPALLLVNNVGSFKSILLHSSYKRPSTIQMKMTMMESDFASAMPKAPEMTTRQVLQQAADRAISTFRGSLGLGVDAIPELDALCKLRERSDNDEQVTDEQLAVGIYELMIERGMNYDENPDNGMLTLTEFNIQDHLDTPEVMSEFLYLYKYGMYMINKGYCSAGCIKDIVEKRLITRTGKTPMEFDTWLGF